MRQVGEEADQGERQTEAVIGEDRQVQIAEAGEEAEDAVSEVERTEDQQEELRRPVRDQRRDQRPEAEATWSESS